MLLAAVAACPAAAQIIEPVAVDGGIVTGTSSTDGKIQIFKGVPFAAPPMGGLRWKPPQPVVRWQGVRKADRFGPDCPQIRAPAAQWGKSPVRPPLSEDCLYLNIWTGARSADERLPVMVWIYGGGYRLGSTAMPDFDGEALARRGVILVSIAYRVGALGFFAHPALSAESPQRVSGNYGLLDQIAALDWVRRNIASFGGDPDRITIFGQSAGSMSTSYLAVSPLATGKFHRLIGETGAGFGLLAPEPIKGAEAKGLAFGRTLGADTAVALRALDAEKLVEAAGTMSGTFQPINDGWVVPGQQAAIYQAGRQNDVAMLIGSNAEEAGEDPSMTLERYRSELVAQYGADADALLRLHPAKNDPQARAAARRLSTIALGDFTMDRWARAQSATGRSHVYSYRFTHRPPIPPQDYPGGPQAAPPLAWHGAEIPYVFDNLDKRDWPWTTADRTLADQLTSYWVNFARSGNPNGPGLPNWPTYQEAPELVMELGMPSRPIARPDIPTMNILERHIGASKP
ncbi:para-nitrobenzyl esterase [Sphingobium sp. B11D3B]|uniref:carboxylesterase/lipase family protein n=1 Tax=Sphingobium sp. B11D3B TaxID=2940575 RepID=UPI00222767E4|nr:carboxylesterase family protein [Sphingobium sp. B11D3B]MCW2389623.1 para-nitrobenzyl esterase [Sphingobium sp. B11D3B]